MQFCFHSFYIIQDAPVPFSVARRCNIFETKNRPRTPLPSPHITDATENLFVPIFIAEKSNSYHECKLFYKYIYIGMTYTLIYYLTGTQVIL